LKLEWLPFSPAMPRFGGGADIEYNAIDPGMQRVRHVESKNVHAGVDELADHFR